jgi:gag-polypeptide of LTR copia-type
MSHECTGTGIDSNTTTSTREIMDINTSLRLTSMLLNGKNYQSWAKAAQISFRGKSKIGYIDGTRQKPTTTLETEEWEIHDSIILSWLLHSMEPSISEKLVHRAETSHEMWSCLKRRFEKTDYYAHIFQIK